MQIIFKVYKSILNQTFLDFKNDFKTQLIIDFMNHFFFFF